MSPAAPPLRLVSVTTEPVTVDETGRMPVVPPPALTTAVLMAVATSAVVSAPEMPTATRRPAM